MSLKPSRVEVDCVYSCPACGCETWYTIRELKIRKHLDCPCGKRTQIGQISRVEVVYSSGKTENFDQSGHNPAISGREVPIDDFVTTLVSLGYKKTEARKLVNAHQDEYDGDDGKFVTFLLQQGATA